MKNMKNLFKCEYCKTMFASPEKKVKHTCMPIVKQDIGNAIVELALPAQWQVMYPIKTKPIPTHA
jgi:hypothetical protein